MGTVRTTVSGRDVLGANRYRHRKYWLRYRYMKVKTSRRQKSVPNLYLRSFGSRNSVPVPSIICLSLTTGFIRTKSLP
ncbi:hypothetical protein Hanom_Chr08g00742201 [Helianthus anomalus]